MVKDGAIIQDSVKEKHLSKSWFCSVSLTINLKELLRTSLFLKFPSFTLSKSRPVPPVLYCANYLMPDYKTKGLYIHLGGMSPLFR